MSYHDLTHKIRIAMAANWFETDALMTFIKDARKINFSIVEQRQQVLQKLNVLNSDAPFQEDDRFPDDLLFVCDALGDWSRKFQQLRLALSYKDRDLKEKLPSTDQKEMNFNDALLSFHNSLNSMQEQLVCDDNVWDRDRLENYFRMDWH